MIPIPTAKDWLVSSRRTLRPQDDMSRAIELLASTRSPVVPVVGDDGHIVGLLTEKDCMRTFCHWVYAGVAGGHVGDYMSTVKSTIDPSLDLLGVASVFLENHFPALPVVAEGELLGMIRRLDVLRGIAEWQRKVQEERTSVEAGHGRPTAIEDLQRVLASHTRDQAAERLGTARHSRGSGSPRA
jgi:CBS domain-containing protein